MGQYQAAPCEHEQQTERGIEEEVSAAETACLRRKRERISAATNHDAQHSHHSQPELADSCRNDGSGKSDGRRGQRLHRFKKCNTVSLDVRAIHETHEVGKQQEHREDRRRFRLDRPLVRGAQPHQTQYDAVGANSPKPLQAEPVFRIHDPKGRKTQQDQYRRNEVRAV